MQTNVSRQARYWTTATADPGRGFAYWVDTLCAELVELDIETSDKENFEAWMLQRSLGSVSLNFIYTREPQKAWRTPEAIGRSRESRFDLLYVRSGTFNFEHYGRHFVVGQEECVLIDSTQTYCFESSGHSAATSLQIPQKWIRSWLAAPEDGVANVLTSKLPWGRALLSTLEALTPDSVEHLVLPGEVVAEQIASLLALAAGPPRAEMSSSQRKLLPRVREVMRENAHDELLSPAKVAAALQISKRHLHALFAATETTFNRELMSIRLERAMRHLEDPSFAKVSVSDIAFRCGFTDSSHFARRFHQRYGKAPRAYRHSVLPDRFTQ